MRLMLHAHDPDMADGAREWRYNLQHTNPKLVWMCMDVHWIFRGKQDPMELLREAGRRIASLHVRNSIHGVWSESLGDGDVDYRAVAGFLQGIGYRGLIGVELAYENGTNPTRPLDEDLKIGRLPGELFSTVRPMCTDQGSALSSLTRPTQASADIPTPRARWFGTGRISLFRGGRLEADRLKGDGIDLEDGAKFHSVFISAS